MHEDEINNDGKMELPRELLEKHLMSMAKHTLMSLDRLHHEGYAITADTVVRMSASFCVSMATSSEHIFGFDDKERRGFRQHLISSVLKLMANTPLDLGDDEDGI